MIVSGAVLVALLALLIEWLGPGARAGRPPEGSVSMRRRSLKVLLAGLACALLAACTLPTAGGFVPTGKLAGPIKDVKTLDGATITVGSKNFSENVLLGKMAIILMQSAGASVTDLTNIPGSAAARQAMLDGQIQAMWEYTGTGWITYLGHDKPIPDEQEQYTAVRDEDLKTNGARLASAGADEQHLRVRDHEEGRRQVQDHQALGDQEGAGAGRAPSASSPS